MRKCLFIFLFFVNNLVLNAQSFDTNWLLGRAYTKWADMSDTTVNFISTIDTIGFRNYDLVWGVTCIDDKDGNPKLFTNGRDIMNDSGKIIEGGNAIMDSLANNLLWFGFESSQASIILPKKDNQYYVIYMSQSDEISLYPNQLADKLYYAIVDMDANNGRGKVLQKKIPIITGDSIGDSRLTACRHANGRDWWLVCHGREYDNKIYVSIVTPDTIYLHHQQYNILPIYKELYAVGQSCFSPDGRHYIASTPIDGTGLYDFDRCTGEFLNTRVMNFIRNDSVFLFTPTGIGGCAFSANSKYFYMTTTRMIAQFCMDSTNIMSSLKFVALYDTSYQNSSPFNTLSLAPNGIIYVANWNGLTNTFHTINHPDTIAPYCEYRKESFSVEPFMDARVLPVLPHFKLGPSPVYTLDAGNDTTVCDSMNISLGYSPTYDLPLTGILDTKIHIEWSASSPYITFDNIHAPYPIATASKRGTYQIYLSLHDTLSTLTCTDRIDTVNVTFINCDTLVASSHFFIPTLWSKSDGNYNIPSLAANSSLAIYNTIGQKVFSDKNYSNNWDTGAFSSGIYIYNLKLANGKEFKGKIFVY